MLNKRVWLAKCRCQKRIFELFLKHGRNFTESNASTSHHASLECRFARVHAVLDLEFEVELLRCGLCVHVYGRLTPLELSDTLLQYVSTLYVLFFLEFSLKLENASCYARGLLVLLQERTLPAIEDGTFVRRNEARDKSAVLEAQVR